MAATLVIYISGYKHNQTMFFLQTITIIGFYLDQSH